MLSAILNIQYYSFNFYGIPVLFVACCILLLGIVVLIREQWSRIVSSFFIICLTMFTWFFCFTWMYWAKDDNTALWWVKVAYLGVPLIPAAVYDFSTKILQIYQQRKYWVWFVWGVAIFFTIMALTTDALINSVFNYPWGFYPKYGWLSIPFILYFFSILLCCLHDYWVNYHRAAIDTIQRKRMQLLFWAFAIACVASEDYLPKFGVDIYPFGYLPIFIFVMMIAYLLMRYRFVDITTALATNQILATIGDPLIVVDADNKIKVVNQALFTIFGYKASDVSDAQIDILLKPSLEKQKLFHQLLQQDNVVDKEFVFYTVDAKSIPVALTISKLLDEHDNVVGTVIVARDIRERKKLEKEARSTRLIFDVTNAMIEAASFEDMLQRCIDKICNSLEWPIGHVYLPDKNNEALLLPSNIWYLQDPEKEADFYQMTMKNPVSFGEGFPGRIWEHRKPIWLTDVTKDDNFHRQYAVRAAAGFPIVVYGRIAAVLEFFSYDVQAVDNDILLSFSILGEQIARLYERRLVQDRIQQLEERNRLILQSAGEGVYGVDQEDKTIFVNPAAARLLGYQQDEMIGKPMHHLVHHSYDNGTHYPEASCPVYGARKRGETHHITTEVLWRKDGSSFPVEYICTPIKKGDQLIGAVVIFTDISHRREVEAKLAQKAEEIETINKKLIKSNQDLEEFAYITSHDLKAPLRAIENLAQWIEEDDLDKLSDKSKEHFKLLRQRTRRMNDLINGILKYSRATYLDSEVAVIDVNELLKEVIESINPPKSFNIHIAENMPTIQTAKTPLMQVFLNLINNSIKHHDKPQGNIDVSVRDLGTFYEFAVEDDGPGIEPQYYEKIFQIFQTLQSRDVLESTGIGLSVVKKIVESQGGKVTVQSQKGEGAIFYFTWPKVPTAHDEQAK